MNHHPLRVAVLLLGSAVPASATDARVDDFLARCPTLNEVAWIDKRYTLAFLQDPTAAAGFVCTQDESPAPWPPPPRSVNLTRLQQRAYQALLLIHTFEFTEPLPWFPDGLWWGRHSLSEWLPVAIRGITFRTDIANSYCCDPPGVINIRATGLAALATDRWIDPGMGTGMDGLVSLIVHEARHAELGPHTCGVDDNSPNELGAWGVQYYLNEWLSRRLADPSYLDAPGGDTAYYRDMAAGSARTLLTTCFCDLR